MKVFLSILLVAGLAVGGYFGWQQWQKKQAPAPTSTRATTALVESRDIQFAVMAAGDIGPADQVSVRPEINGRIAELPIDIGDKVAKGDRLCRLDDQDLRTERAARLTELDGARLQVEKALRNLQRSGKLYADRLIAQEVIEDMRTDYALSTNSAERAENAVRLVEDRLSKTVIKAPFDCTVLTRPVSLGQTVSGSAGFNSGTEIMTIANLKDMVINAHINQADVTRLKSGQTVDIQVESVPGLKMHGVVERIAPQAVVKNGIKGFGARVLIKDIDDRIRPGMTAVLNIPVASAENVLAVPLSAVYFEDGERFVYVKQGETFERRLVLIGLSDNWFAEVQNGLSAGDVVALEKPEGVTPAPMGNTTSNTASNGSGGKATSGKSSGKRVL